MMKTVNTLCLGALCVLGACTWVKPEPEAAEIQVVKPEHVENCKKLGEASAQTKDKLIGLQRKSKKVSEELLTLAKNEAASMGGNTLVSVEAPEDGKQSFLVYLCE